MFSLPKNRKLVSNYTIATCAASLLLASSMVGASDAEAPASGFHWVSSAPLILPPTSPSQKYYGVKDPSIVYYQGQYHVFMTTAGDKGWGLAYTSFSDWKDASTAKIVPLDKSPMGPGYRAAPQVFYFAPQKLWYLIYQGGDPLYSTTKDINDPLSWSSPKPFFASAPDIVRQANGNAAWLDFWIICDEEKCYLFFSDDGGRFYRAETDIENFPNGFHGTSIAMKAENRDDMFEASNTYKVAGTNSYITLIEAMSPKGRYFRAWKADRLDGDWQPLTTGEKNVFAGADNVSFDSRIWSEGVSHGEMVRAGVDQTLTIDPCTPLRYLYQGLDKENGVSYQYIELPYRLGLLTATGPNPVSEMCKR